MPVDNNSITQVLNKWSDLGVNERNNIIKMLYPELKRIASIQININNRKITQSTTEVVNEAYFKLMDQSSLWKNRNHFFAISATVMRRVIIDLTRKKTSLKKGSGYENVNYEDVNIPVPFFFEDWIILNEAIEQLGKINPMLTKVVEMKAVMGMSIEESADVLEISLSTVVRHWKFSKAWLANYLKQS
jgi:RNA polymerase sigma factor (TIGR02999 family)